MEHLIGREEEKAILQRALLSNEAELVAIYGRRRIGKTFLIRNFYQKELFFEISGVHNAILSDQLANFALALTRSMKSLPIERTSRDSIYKLTDEYSFFYIKFIVNSKSHGAGVWIRLSEGSSWKSWSGLAFESICLKNEQQIKKAIGIADVYTEVSPWRYAAKEKEAGAQIDILFDRRDNCINLCEIKFSIIFMIFNYLSFKIFSFPLIVVNN